MAITSQMTKAAYATGCAELLDLLVVIEMMIETRACVNGLRWI